MLLHQRLRVRSVLAHQRPAGDRRDDRVAAVAQVGVVVRLATARVRVRVGFRCGCSFGEVLCAPSVSVDGWHDHKAGRVAGRLAPGSGAARARPLYRACPSQRAPRRQRGGSSIHAPTVSLALFACCTRKPGAPSLERLHVGRRGGPSCDPAGTGAAQECTCATCASPESGCRREHFCRDGEAGSTPPSMRRPNRG